MNIFCLKSGKQTNMFIYIICLYYISLFLEKKFEAKLINLLLILLKSPIFLLPKQKNSRKPPPTTVFFL
jgi:hypothetical protein